MRTIFETKNHNYEFDGKIEDKLRFEKKGQKQKFEIKMRAKVETSTNDITLKA